MANQPTYISSIIGRAVKNGMEGPLLRLADAEVAMLCDLGLGPLAYQLHERSLLDITQASIDLLQGADLTSRLLYRQTSATVSELVELLGNNGIQTTLLKGISVSEQFYSPPHSRIMGDVDVLVGDADLSRADELMLSAGYVADDAEALDGPHHHRPAVRHPETSVIVELHSGLFSPDSELSRHALFGNQAWLDHLVPARFGDSTVFRFTPEYQLAYTIAHWATERKWARNVFGVLDCALIISRTDSFDWALFTQWMNDCEWLGACTSIMLQFLARNGIVELPEQADESIRNASARFGRRNIQLMLWLMRTFPMGGRERTLLFLDQQSARAGWRSMLTPGRSFGSAATAYWRMLTRIFSRITLNPVKIARRLARSGQRSSGQAQRPQR